VYSRRGIYILGKAQKGEWMTIGIVGYGMVGKALHGALLDPRDAIIVDPKYTECPLAVAAAASPALFICLPTDDGDEFKTLRATLDELVQLEYTGVVIVKSTCLPGVLDPYEDALVLSHVPEFLSRATALIDMVHPQVLVIGGRATPVALTQDILSHQTNVEPGGPTIRTDLRTAAMIKYMYNSFYAMKVTFFNQIKDACAAAGADYDTVARAARAHPWVGTGHTVVPGPDGERGFGGPCLPKDTKALAVAFDLKLLDTVLTLNEEYRNGSSTY